MKNINISVVQAFSVNGTGGNPAGIVFDADDLGTDQKQMIAAAAGFPETAFVSSSAVADYKLDFFTPVKQIPHCGHATIAAFSLMRQRGMIKADSSSKETIDGCRSIVFKGDKAFMEQLSPTVLVPSTDFESINRSLHIENADLAPDTVPVIVNTGNSFLLINIRSEDVLKNICYNTQEVTELSRKYNLIGFYLFTNSSLPGSEVTTRMFAPYYGIAEESATGMAAGPLAAWLFLNSDKSRNTFLIEQGRFMLKPSPSLLEVEMDAVHGEIRRLFAGGTAYQSKSINIVIP